MIFDVHMTIECEENDYLELKKAFENHIEQVIDLESWPEIKNVFRVTTSNEKLVY